MIMFTANNILTGLLGKQFYVDISKPKKIITRN
jgi:hypothetical protein